METFSVAMSFSHLDFMSFGDYKEENKSFGRKMCAFLNIQLDGANFSRIFDLYCLLLFLWQKFRKKKISPQIIPIPPTTPLPVPAALC